MTTLTAQLCTPEEQMLSASHNSPIHCLTRDESIALAFVAEAGIVSAFACLTTFALILRNVRRHARLNPGKWRLIDSPMDIYLLSLFAGDTVLSISGIVITKWVQDGKSHTGGWCDAQAISLSLGAMTVAFSTLAIAVHTFVMVWCNKGFHANNVARLVVIVTWIFSIVYVTAVGAVYRSGSNDIFRPAPYWCWIGGDYEIHRLVGAYIWMWIALFTSFLLYFPLFLWIRGNVTVGDKFWSFRIHKRGEIDDLDGMRRRAMGMIAYPLVYTVVVLPLSVARWIGFEQQTHGNRIITVPASATIGTLFIFSLSGLSNVLLFFLTRPNLLLFGKSSAEADHEQPATPSSEADSIGGR